MNNQERSDYEPREGLLISDDERKNIAIVLNAYRSIRAPRELVAYVTMPITTGLRFYQVLTENGVHSLAELKDKLGSHAVVDLIISPNIAEGVAFADELSEKTRLIIIAPSIFEAKEWRWTQEAYMVLWYNVLTEMAGKHFVMDGWEYSTGGVKEVVFSLFLQWRVIRNYNLQQASKGFGLFFGNLIEHHQKMFKLEDSWKMHIYDADGEEICLGRALKKVVAAIEKLKSMGFDYDNLIKLAWELKVIPGISPFGFRGEQFGLRPLDSDYYEARNRLEKLFAEKS